MGDNKEEQHIVDAATSFLIATEDPVFAEESELTSLSSWTRVTNTDPEIVKNVVENTPNITKYNEESQQNFRDQLLTPEINRLLQHLTATSKDISIDDEKCNEEVKKCISAVRQNYYVCHEPLKQGVTRVRKRLHLLGRGALLQSGLTEKDLETELSHLVNLIATLNKENYQIIKVLNSLLRKVPNTKSDNKPKLKPFGPRTKTKRSLQIIRENLSVLPDTLTVRDVVTDETKGILQYLSTVSTTDPTIKAKDYNAKIKKVLADILSGVNNKVSSLCKQRKTITKETFIITQKAQTARAGNQFDDEKTHLEASRVLDKRNEHIGKLIVGLHNEKSDLVNRLRQVKAFPIEGGQNLKCVPASSKCDPAPSKCDPSPSKCDPAPSVAKQIITIEEHPPAIIVAQKNNPPSEEVAFLRRLNRHKNQELRFAQSQRELGRPLVEKAHQSCHQVAKNIVGQLTPLLQPTNVLKQKNKLLNLLIEKYPPRFDRVEVVLTAEDVSQISDETLRVGDKTYQIKPVSPNTTIVTTSDGGSGDEKQRNFTRRLNTIIEFELGAARQAAAKKDFSNVKLHLACASALIAKPEGFAAVLKQLDPNNEDFTEFDDNTPEEGIDTKETEIIVSNAIRRLHCQIGFAESNGKAPLLGRLDPQTLLAQANRTTSYFSKESLQAFIECRHYGNIFGNLLIAGQKCIIGNDLAEKSAIFKHATDKKDLIALNYLVQKYRSQVPWDFVAEQPKQQDQPNLCQPKGTNRDKCQKGNKEKQGQPPQSAKLSFRELRSLGVPLEEAKSLSSKNTQGIQDQLGGTSSTFGDPESQLKEFNPQLPKNFKIQLPGPPNTNSTQGWKGNMEGANKDVVSGRPSDIKLVASGSKPTVTTGGYDQWQPVQSPSQASNIVVKMLTGKKKPAPAKRSSGSQPVIQPAKPVPPPQRHNLTPVQMQSEPMPQAKASSKNWTQNMGKRLFPQTANLLMGNNATLNYPKGIPRSFLMEQERLEQQRYEQGLIVINTENRPIWPTVGGFQQPTFTQTFTEAPSVSEANTPTPGPTPQPSGSYSPTDGQDMFAEDEGLEDDEIGDGSESPSVGQKRLSAFQRLGPVAAPKKPKLTINLLFSKDDAVREVVDGEAEQRQPAQPIPVYQRQDILTSTNETVVKYLAFWPWKNNVHARKTAGPRTSKSVMMMEEEQMSEGYESNRHYVKVVVSKYPSFYKKEDVLDLVLETVNGKSFIPCFIEFTPEECTFLVLRSQKALLTLHKKGLYLHENGHDMPIHLSLTDLTLNNIGLIPRIVLGKIVTAGYDGEMKLNLDAFCLKSDISHFIYFPLNRPANQAELIQLQSGVSWEHLRELSLANNRLTTIETFELARKCPKLKHLDLSNNFFERVTVLLPCRGLQLDSLKLEGNPLCTDYTDPRHYVRVIKMMFPSLTELDGVTIPLHGELPSVKQNYCPSEAKPLVDRLLDVYFPLLDAAPEERMPIEELYHENAILTITYSYKLRFQPIFRYFRDLFTRCRLLEEENLDSVEGSAAIAKHVSRWPAFKHDPFTLVVDVMHHDESSTILRISGVFKITSESLAEDEHMLCFTRTLVLRSLNGSQYKIHNEMVYWDAVSPEMASQAFQITTLKSKKLSLKMESAPDDDLKDKLIAIFMKLTQLSRKLSLRCLEIRNWDFKVALEYYMKLLKLNSLDTLDMSDD